MNELAPTFWLSWLADPVAVSRDRDLNPARLTQLARPAVRRGLRSLSLSRVLA